MTSTEKKLISNIEAASRGEDLRTALVDAFQFYADNPEAMIQRVDESGNKYANLPATVDENGIVEVPPATVDNNGIMTVHHGSVDSNGILKL